MNLFSGFLVLLMLASFACEHVQPRPQVRARSIAPRPETKGRIVIDAGHGGIDSGAIGISGVREKDLTLDIALRLQRLFKRHFPDIDVVMTRTQDVYLALEERIKIAQAQPADLFISLHINSNELESANGFEIYSNDVASDRHAERLAARENKVPGKKSGADFVLADLRAFSHRSDSDRLARLVAQGIKSQLKTVAPESVRDRGYNQAIFHVLFVNMPAVLAELFFVSNRAEEKMLRKAQIREFIARGLFLGLRNYLKTTKKVSHAQR